MRKILAVALMAILAPLSLAHAQTTMATRKPMMGGKKTGSKMTGKKKSSSMMGKKKSSSMMGKKKTMPMRNAKTGRFMKSPMMTTKK